MDRTRPPRCLSGRSLTRTPGRCPLCMEGLRSRSPARVMACDFLELSQRTSVWPAERVCTSHFLGRENTKGKNSVLFLKDLNTTEE